MRPAHRATGAPEQAPQHDATGIVWGALLSLLLWPLIVMLAVHAAGWL